MKKYLALSILALVGCAHMGAGGGGDAPLSEPLKAPESLQVTSMNVVNHDKLATDFTMNGFGCTGKNTRPELSWSGAPEGTKSYAIVVHDPDAPTGVGFFHWVAFDIPATTTSLASEAELPAPAINAKNDAGTNQYIGPCPPPGPAHRYIYTVYALDVPSVGLGDTAGGALTRFAINAHVLAYGRLTATYGR